MKKELNLLCDRVHYHHVTRSIPRHYAAAAAVCAGVVKGYCCDEIGNVNQNQKYKMIIGWSLETVTSHVCAMVTKMRPYYQFLVRVI